MDRRFAGKQRTALFLAADGKCSKCGEPLEQGWHADHVHPYSKGGETDVINGQALCAKCNLEKGDRMEQSRIELRKWQVREFEKYFSLTGKNCLANVWTGAGKTYWALAIARRLLDDGVITRVVVVVPGRQGKKQWADAAHKFGIELDPVFSNTNARETHEYAGHAITYASIASAPDTHRINCSSPTLAILDEIHHAGETLSWGKIEHAFEPARRRILLSATPFRHDEFPIPFVTYDATGKCITDINYSYANALEDSVCRPVIFPSFEGKMNWYSDGLRKSGAFSDEMTEREYSQLVRTALNPDGAWFKDVVGKADRQITEMRANGDPKAKMMVLGDNVLDAKRSAAIYKNITGHTPIVATSDDKEACDKIDKFRDSDDRCIVSVRMVSEGVDIPNLRVGVYATNVQTELFFIQAVGRFLRWTPGIEEQSAYMYIPAIPKIVDFAMKIKEERDNQLKEAIERHTREVAEQGQLALGTFVPIDSEAFESDVIFDGGKMDPTEIDRARNAARALGLTTDPVLLLRWQALYEPAVVNVTPQNSIQPPPETKANFRLKDDSKKIKTRLVNKYAAMTGMDHKDVNTLLNEFDGKWEKTRSREDVDACVTYLQQLIDSFNG